MSSSRYPLYSSVVLVFFLVRGYGERTKLFPETAIVIEHKTLQLDCFYEDGDPKQSRACQWSKNGVHDIVAIIDENCFVINLFPDIYNFKCTNRTVTTMFINSTDRTLHNTTFSCSFIVGSVTTTGTSTVRVIVPVSSVRLTEPGTDVVITTENSKVTFICNASAAHPRPSITWNSDSRTSFDYSDDVEILKNISVRSDYDGYLYTVMSTLTFYPTKNDNGSSIYCNATNTETQNITSTNKALLNVQYPPTTPIFFTLSNVPLNNVAIIINNALTIRCKSIGNPFPSYTWTTPQKKEVSGEELNIESIQKVDDGTYSCMAYSVFATEGINRNYSNSASLQVTVFFPPDSPKFYYITPATTELIENSTINVVNGDDVSVLCNSSGKPHPVSVWNVPTPSDTLSIKSVRVDVKNTCTSLNAMTDSARKTRNGSVSRELRIIVLHPPDTPVIKNLLSEDTVEFLHTMSVIENSKLVLECSAKSKPHSSFTWSHSMIGNINLSKQLTVNRIKRNQSGTYTCLAKNEMIRSFGNKETGKNNRSIYIDVLYKAAIKYFGAADFENNNNMMTINQSEETQIICKVESNPFPNTTIFFKGRLVNETIRSDTITYNLINSTCSDAGRYICKGKNEFNYEADASTELFLYVKCLPQPSADQPPEKNVSAALTDSAIFLFHAAPYYDPGIIEFRWFKQNNGWRILLRNGTKAYITSSDIHSVLRIVDVSEADYGMYILEYKNSVGMNNFSFYLQQKNQTEEIFKGTDTNYLPMVICIFTAVLVIVGITLGIVIYIWRCQRKTDNGNKSDDNICGMNTTSGETNSINCESVYEGLKPMDERGYVEMKEQAYAILKPKGSVDT